MRTVAAVVALLAIVLSASGCGYTTESLYTTEVQTVALGIFENLTFRRGLEVDLTRALKRQLRTRTHLRQVQPTANPDSTLRGVILDVEERVLSEDEDDNVLEERVTVTVRVEWVAQGGTVIAGEEMIALLPRVRGSADVATGRGEGVEFGTVEALDDLAERIVLLLEDSSW